MPPGRSWFAPIACAMAACLGLAPTSAVAQGPTIDPGRRTVPGEAPTFGDSPGNPGPLGGSPGDTGIILGVRPGAGAPRVPSSIDRPAAIDRAASGFRSLELPEPFPGPDADADGTPDAAEADADGDLGDDADVAPIADDPGPADGLTLDRAIDLLLSRNPDLRAQSLELPQADADVLTAGLRSNPILYADAQLIPYGSFSPERPGGGTQYDLNVTFPLDLSRKRRARVDVACRARRVLEAQFQDAARRAIAELAAEYVDALDARATTRAAEASLRGLDELVAALEKQLAAGDLRRDELQRVRLQRDAARVAIDDLRATERRTLRDLGTLLALPPTQAERLVLRGSLRDEAPVPPPPDQLVALALGARPDLAAYRLGVARAGADVRLATAERYQDAYLLLQPYTFQDNAPFGSKSAHSWAVGLTVPVPIFNRNQGNIRRARLNVDQTRAELAALTARVDAEVRRAADDYDSTRTVVERLERTVLPEAIRLLAESNRLAREGEITVFELLSARRDFNDTIRQYRDALSRHRRAMLALNAAVGFRLLP